MLMIPILASCGAKGPKEAILAGKFFNSEDTVVYVASKGAADTVYLDKNGEFKFKVMLDKPQLFSLNISRTQTLAYLAPGDSSYVEFDVTAQSDGPAFSADCRVANTNIFKSNMAFRDIMGNWREIFGLNAEQFDRKIDSIQQILSTLAGSIKGESKSMVELEKARVKYAILNLKINYPDYFAYLNDQEVNPDSIDYSYLDGVDINNADHLMFDDYLNIINTYVQSKFNKMLDYKEISKEPAKDRLPWEFMAIDSLVDNQTVRDYLKMNRMMEDLDYGNFYELDGVVQKYFDGCQTLKYKEKVSSKFCTKMILAPGKPAPVFRYSDINGKEYSLEDFRGNLVYIDFWATWCGPCRYELPYLKTLEKDYHSKKVVFVSISLDDNKSAWEKMVKEQDMKGVQLYGEGAWNSFVAKSYQIRGIPTFFLIDANGSILKPNAPRPSSDEIHSVLDENLLKL